jgi:signal-transduction protein with cAMP-binding, CBS, and nucleotidyltransferase domain
MAIYESIPTFKLAKDNELISCKTLPELVHLDDSATSIFIDFSEHMIATISPQAAIDVAIHEMKMHHQQMLLVEQANRIIGLVGYEDVVSERPLRIMHEKKLNRSEITVEMVMKTANQILAIDSASLKHAQVGHIINTIKEHAAHYLFVIKKRKDGKHVIKGLFATSQIGRQLHIDLVSLFNTKLETILDIHYERKG